MPDEIHLFRSNFDVPEDFAPSRHVFFNEHEKDHEIFDDLPRYGPDSPHPIAWGRRPARRVLFLCTGNSARSILAEAALNLKSARLGDERVRGHSAGSHPTGVVHPQALQLIGDQAWRLDRVWSKSWEFFGGDRAGADSANQPAPDLDWVITLCDEAAAEQCPAFPGSPERQHWSLVDPASGAVAFEASRAIIEERIDRFLDLIEAVRSP